MANNHITERISFLTQVHTAWDGREQRHALRAEPRRMFSYDYSGMNAEQSQYIRMLIYHSQSMLIPFIAWQSANWSDTPFYTASKTLSIGKEWIWCYRNCSMVELWRNDELGGRKYDIEYLTANGDIGVKKELGSDWGKGTRIAPVFYGILQTNGNFSAQHGDVSELTVNLEIPLSQNAPYLFPEEYGPDYDEEDPLLWKLGMPPTFMGAEIMRFIPQWDSAMDGEYEKNANRLDMETGIYRFDEKSYNPITRLELTFALVGRPQINNFQRFFWRHKGRWRSFFMPSWSNDITLAESVEAGSISLPIKQMWHWKYYQKSEFRKLIAVFFKDGRMGAVRISGYSRDEETRRGIVFLETELEFDIPVEQVKAICFFSRWRFDTDDLDIDYETNDTAIASVTVREVYE